MLHFMFITNDPVLARDIASIGVKRIFVDWKCLGNLSGRDD
jgi:hypothetical protein